MKVPQRKFVGGIFVVIVCCFATALASNAQSPKPATKPTPTLAKSMPATPTYSEPGMDAERAAIWNSPNMLRARAWLQEYCATSKKVTPDEAQQYMNELEHMTPIQMKLWLMKFDDEEDQKKQQRAFYQQAEATAMKQAQAADLATRRSYGAIEKEENGAASEEQAQVNEQDANEQQNQDVKQEGPYTPYGQGYYPGGGIHYHFHLYPY
jgi:hypothetical protein